MTKSPTTIGPMILKEVLLDLSFNSTSKICEFYSDVRNTIYFIIYVL